MILLTCLVRCEDCSLCSLHDSRRTSTRVVWKVLATIRYFQYSFIHRRTTFMYLQYSRPLKFFQMFGRPYSTDTFISCLVPGPLQWFFQFGEDIVIARSRRVNMKDVSESPIASGARRPWQPRCDSLPCHEWWCSVPPNVVVFSRVYAVTISSPKWKNHREWPGRT